MSGESSMGFEHFKYAIDEIKKATTEKVAAEVMNSVANVEIANLKKEIDELRLELSCRDAVIESKDDEIRLLRDELAKRTGCEDIMKFVAGCIMLERIKLMNAFAHMRSMPKQAYLLGTTLNCCLPSNASDDDRMFMVGLLEHAGCSDKQGINGDILTDSATKIVKN